MKIETDRTTAYSAITIVAIVTISCLASYGCHQTEETKREAIKAGLEERPATQYSSWVKPH